jgi:hypothetical protein
MNNALLNAVHDRPCAAEGLTSYRYRGEYGWIMIGAKDDADALHEASRSMAPAERDAAACGLSVTWETDDMPWDGDCPAPKIVAVATVYAPGVDPSTANARFPYADGPRYGFVPAGGVYRQREVLASLGGIGLDSWRDDYRRVVEAELLSEALENLNEENDRLATREASELSSRATYAGVSL